LRNDSYPRVLNFPKNNTWIAAGRSVYHVEREPAGSYDEPRAILVSLFADQQHRELLDRTGDVGASPQLSFEDGSLSFRFFSGTYAWRSPPLYEYRLFPSESWTPLDPTSILRFPKLRDGTYKLEVREAGPQEPSRSPFTLSFTIEPPWYRTAGSYTAYALAILAAIFGIARWMSHRSLQRTAVLETLVQERTKELGATMEKLAEETKNAATLAERTRLAGEIHDSVQQGLSGAILHLHTTMTHPSLISEVRSHLNTVKNMLSYSREEVQQAVWNLESPLLQNAEIGDALRKLVTYINSAGASIEVVTHEEAGPLEPAIQHNLLRLAQEAITNAVKHSRARHIDVSLQSNAERVVLSVSDNGCGFDPAASTSEASHFGLRGMRSRVKAINAQLEILSSPGAGTIVRVTLVPKAPHCS
jgi:signal transduction histidine kinase